MSSAPTPTPAPVPATLMPTQTWVFQARCLRVIDGDTIDVHIDQGMHSLRLERLRLLNVNAPETKGATRTDGLASTAFTGDWIRAAQSGVEEWPLLIRTYKSDAFGRYLTLVWRVSDGACLNDDLITSGMARVDIRP